MQINISDIVKSTAGNDKGSVLMVLDIQGEFLVLADGKKRRIEKPKRKKRKHTEFISVVNSPIKQKLLQGEEVLNSEIRKTLSQFVGLTANVDQA